MEKLDVAITVDPEAEKVNLRFASSCLSMSADEALEIASFLIEGANWLRTSNDNPKADGNCYVVKFEDTPEVK